jgi:hypothetical protein
MSGPTVPARHTGNQDFRQLPHDTEEAMPYYVHCREGPSTLLVQI